MGDSRTSNLRVIEPFRSKGKNFVYLLELRRKVPGATDEAIHRSMMQSGYIWGWMDCGERDRKRRDLGRKR
jgi:hypothetical protein